MKMTFYSDCSLSKCLLAVAATLTITLSSCESYLDGTQLPANTIAAADVYSNDNMVSTVVTGIYLNMNGSGPFTGSASGNIGYTMGLYTDELKNLLSGNFADVFYKNAVQSGQSGNWSDLYKKLFTVNTAIDGINTSKGNLAYKDQWLGECYFLRAYFYYYLVNIYGPVPLALTNDYTINNRLSRAPEADVYKQIIADLKMAQSLLSDEYKNGYGATTPNRFRPNKAVATAMLARAYLYAKDWANAEAQATALIGNTNYEMPAPDQVFLANSKETIWALATSSPKITNEYGFYNNGMPATITPPQTPASSSVFAALSSTLLNAFEAGDLRFTNWTRSSTVVATSTSPATTYYFPAKYKSAAPNAEYQVLLRLSEQYLIRAEARAMQNKSNAIEDLNVVRLRAGLQGVSGGTQAALLAAIARERQMELFTECGHRFFDLKRTSAIDAVMAVVAPIKLTTWKSYMAYWPIPPNDLLQNPNLTPNPGYLQ
ncbi:RagB/SusD family nutrient uptake outer membrane protein [Chitinophaga sp.]|uniref:RagB/SusD family nutrient uptake outer membrane protein n=1 Tax=Chitinophaga sp. TaxID=1869181 RepID=UPI002F93FCC0